jgi:hypothetical protein
MDEAEEEVLPEYNPEILYDELVPGDRCRIRDPNTMKFILKVRELEPNNGGVISPPGMLVHNVTAIVSGIAQKTGRKFSVRLLQQVTRDWSFVAKGSTTMGPPSKRRGDRRQRKVFRTK